MSNDEFWHGDVRLAIAYREKYRLELERRDQQQWASGYYTFQALMAASPAFREISKGPDYHYPKHPLFAAKLSEEEIKAEQDREQMNKIRAAFEAMAARANEKIAARLAAQDEERSSDE